MVVFALIQKYFDAVVAKAGDDITNAPHKKFWATYQSLTSDHVPGVKCNGSAFPAIKWLDAAKTKADADNSPLYLILTNPSGFCQKDQMPPGGPFVLDAGYSVTLADGSIVAGSTIASDVHDWIAAGAAEF